MREAWPPRGGRGLRCCHSSRRRRRRMGRCRRVPSQAPARCHLSPGLPRSLWSPPSPLGSPSPGGHCAGPATCPSVPGLVALSQPAGLVPPPQRHGAPPGPPRLHGEPTGRPEGPAGSHRRRLLPGWGRAFPLLEIPR